MGIMDKKCEQRTGLDEWYQDFINRLPKWKQQKLSGIGMGKMTEPLPSFKKAKCEYVVGGSNGWYNSFIVLGRDRPASTAMNDFGYGPKGCTGAASIDLVVGRFSAGAAFGLMKGETQDGKLTKVNPDFIRDAARIYLSQRSDIDDYFGISKESGNRSPSKSSVAIKADAVRLIAREGIKLCSGVPDEFNSQGTKHADGKDGIYLIYGNKIEPQGDYSLQPLVKGDNLVELLKTMCDMIGDCVDLISGLNTDMIELCGAYGAHQHLSSPSGGPTSPIDAPITPGVIIPKRVADIVKAAVGHSKNDATTRINYFEFFGGKYILSSWNKTN